MGPSRIASSSAVKGIRGTTSVRRGMSSRITTGKPIAAARAPSAHERANELANAGRRKGATLAGGPRQRDSCRHRGLALRAGEGAAHICAHTNRCTQARYYIEGDRHAPIVCVMAIAAPNPTSCTPTNKATRLARTRASGSPGGARTRSRARCASLRVIPFASSASQPIYQLCVRGARGRCIGVKCGEWSGAGRGAGAWG